MTQEEKDLLLKDLCGRLPYGVKISPKEKDTGEYDKTSGSNYMYPDVISVEAFIPDGDNTRIEYGDWIIYLDNIQLYLRPMSSMTEEETKTYRTLQDTACSYHYEFGDIVDDLLYFDNDVSLDYLNSIHIDYRGLIPMGIALEAREGMYE